MKVVLQEGIAKTVTINAPANDTGAYSQVVDLGSDSFSHLCKYELFANTASATLGKTVDVYASFKGSSTYDGNQANASGAAISNSSALVNLDLVGVATVDDSGATGTLCKSGTFNVRDRYLRLSLWNNGAGTLGNLSLVVTPLEETIVS